MGRETELRGVLGLIWQMLGWIADGIVVVARWIGGLFRSRRDR
jgi:hypothetical protein